MRIIRDHRLPYPIILPSNYAEECDLDNMPFGAIVDVKMFTDSDPFEYPDDDMDEKDHT